jgi:histidine ammonia-lyase
VTPSRPTVVIGSEPLSPAELLQVARNQAAVTLAPGTEARLEPARALVQSLLHAEQPTYGVNTGFGALANTRIRPDQAGELQHSLLRSHAAGSGDELPEVLVRGIIAIRCATLARGHSGARPELLEGMVRMLNDNLLGAVPDTGSLGASGDLAQLAHTFLPLVGEGPLRDGRSPAEAGLAPIRLQAKEGLALLNGTDAMLAAGILLVDRVTNLVTAADVVAAMSIEALLGTDRPFQERLHRLRPHPGQLASASNLARLLRGSRLMASHRDSDHAVQDAYSLRCTPQVHGACRDTLTFARDVFERELASTIDNPVVFVEDGDVVSGGNFHGEPLAFAHDFMAIALAELGSISERRINRMLDSHLSQGLPAFLSPDSGLNSGLMLTQYNAAAVVTELRLNAQPASVHSISTSAEQEDHVSMGWTAAKKALRSADLLAGVLGTELLSACQALELRHGPPPSAASAAVLKLVRGEVEPLALDRVPAPDMATVTRLIREGAVVASAAAECGQLA